MYMYNDKLRNTVTLMVAKEYGLGNKIFAGHSTICAYRWISRGHRC